MSKSHLLFFLMVNMEGCLNSKNKSNSYFTRADFNCDSYYFLQF